MAAGTVRWFNNRKGYGFIAPDDGGNDIFVHISAVRKAGLKTLTEGAKLTYDISTERERPVADNLVLSD